MSELLELSELNNAPEQPEAKHSRLRSGSDNIEKNVSSLRCEPKISDTLARSRKRLARRESLNLGDVRGNEEVTAASLSTLDGRGYVLAFIDPRRREQESLKGDDSKYLLDVNAHKILNALSIAAKFQGLPSSASWDNVVGSLTAELDINELGRKMGFTDMHNAQKEIRRAALALFTNVLQITADDDDKYNGVYFSILDGVKIKNGKLIAVFSPLFIRAVTDRVHSVVTFYPDALLKLRENAYRVGWKLSRWAYSDMQHFSRLTIGRDKFYTYRLRVKTLVRAADLPDYTPTAKKFLTDDKSPQARAVRSGGNKWLARTREPLEAALDEVETSGIIKSWYYTRAKGELLSDAELESINSGNASYQDWTGLYVEYVWAFDTLAHERSQRSKRRRKRAEAAAGKTRGKSGGKSENALVPQLESITLDQL